MKLLRGFYRVQKVAGTARKSVIKKAGSFVLAFALCFLTSVSSSCGVSFSYENVSLVTWNVQTFFDAVNILISGKTKTGIKKSIVNDWSGFAMR